MRSYAISTYRTQESSERNIWLSIFQLGGSRSYFHDRNKFHNIIFISEFSLQRPDMTKIEKIS